MESLFLDYWHDLTDAFLNPQKRVFLGYLGAALAIALAVETVFGRGGPISALARLFSRKIWLSRSARADYKILLINQALMMGIAPRLLSKLVLATLLFETLHRWFDGRTLLLTDAPAWTIALLFTAVLFLMDDGSKYLVHRALHRWPALWAFHRVHHTAETLTPFTVYRTHPMEAVIFSLRSIVVQAAAVGGFLYFFGSRAELLTLLGANAFLFLFNAAGANLRHSHVWITYGVILEHLLISPAQHQLHHSMDDKHHDRNYGAVLALWDWLGGSLALAPSRRRFRFGIADAGVAPHTLRSVYIAPFAESLGALAAPWRKAASGILNVARRTAVTAMVGLFVGFALFGAAALSAGAAELNIYSHRQPFLIKPFLEAYTKKTGTKINVVYASKGLAQRLQAEGARSPADVILTVDIARLYVYADKDLLAPVDSQVLKANIPAHLRDAKDRWFAFSKRARVIAVANRAKDADAIKRYEDLADPKWRGRICSRPGSHVYNRALIASIINASGVKAAEAWAKGVVDNLARRPQGNDRAQVKAVFQGQCDIAIINNYYYGKLKHSEKPEQRQWAAAVHLIFPNQNDRGTHVNISGGGVAKYSKHKEEAVRFLEFLTSQQAQHLYGEINFEYPVNPKVSPPKELASWGKFVEDKMPIARIAELAAEAQKVIDRVGW
jgi:iron(III) transport system substrate-binding protein